MPKKTEEEVNLKRIREMVKAVLASSAFSFKEEAKQLERVTSQLKAAEAAFEAGLFSREELEAKRKMTGRELALVRRAWAVRRKMAEQLITKSEEQMDAIEKSLGDDSAA